MFRTIATFALSFSALLHKVVPQILPLVFKIEAWNSEKNCIVKVSL